MEPNPGKPHGHSNFRLALIGVTLGVVALVSAVHGQRVVEGKGFKFANYFDAPDDTKIKTLLEGARAVPQPGNRLFVITDAKVQTFRKNGEGEMTVEAPECVYDATERAINSSGPFRLRTADGQFFLEGVGFLWRQTNSTLFVSNQVHTVVRASLMSGPGIKTNAAASAAATNATAATPETIDIFSDRFDYALDAGQGVYKGNVRVTGTNLALVGGTLTVDVPATNRHLERLIATENVVVDYIVGAIKTQARGQRVSYDAEKDVLHVNGQPTWRADLREGRGDELLLDRKNGIFESAGNAWLKMPSQGSGGGGFLPHALTKTNGAAAGPGTNQWVEIFSDRYVIRTNAAEFSEHVRVTDKRDDVVQGKMSCELLTATFAGTNELRQLVADRKVIIESDTNRFTSGRAVYTGTNGLLTLTENPAWKAGLRDGKGDLIFVNLPRSEMTVQTNAIMRLPADELGKTMQLSMPGGRKPPTVSRTNQFAVIFCDEYVVGPEVGEFRRNVRIEHPQMKWASDMITATMPASGGKIPRIVADRSVAFDMVDDRNRTLHGIGDRAVYTYTATPTATNEWMELTGAPAVVTASTNMVGRNKIILLDLTKHTVRAPGSYTIAGTITSDKGTNGISSPTDMLNR